MTKGKKYANISHVYRNISKTNTRKPKKRFSLKALVNDFGKVKSFRNHAFQRTLFQSKQIGQEIKKIDC